MQRVPHTENGGTPAPGKKRIVFCVAVVLLVIFVLALVLGLTLRKQETFQSTFLERCNKFQGYNCQKMWKVFTEAFVGQDPCNVSMEAYDPLIDVAPFKHTCNRMMFWSGTQTLVHEFQAKRGCFETLEDTVLGNTLNNMKWCGNNHSNEILTSGCPRCDNSAVQSFWKRVSAGFADAACGNVTAMLNGSLVTPFRPASVFASVEVKRFNSTRIENLTLLLVTSKNSVTNCTNASLKDLQKALDPGIAYSCKETTESQLRECGSARRKTCGPCW